MTVFNLRKFIKSFLYAIRGVRCAFREQNFKVHIVFSIIVFVLILLFDPVVLEIAILVIIITFILVLEIINSIFERIVDILQPRVHPHAKTIKDMMAAAVLVASLGSFFVGLLIFLPYFKGII
ncbi:MAG: diacylglycerol kinase [Patescibacteria group bacterium]|nr:diacylglycerol kinase [Patescibacteria group bacterium]